jgi:hypothetical protein
MALTAPEWLTQRGGGLKPGSDARAYFVMLNSQPLYTVLAVPVAGKFGCTIIQANNGKRLDSSGTAATVDEALRLGLEDLRKAMGW